MELIKKEFNDIISEEQIEFLKKFDEMEKRAKVIKDAIKTGAKDFLIKNNLTKEGYEQDGIKLVYTKAHSRKNVDTDKMKKDGIYEDYLVESEVSDSVKILITYED